MGDKSNIEWTDATWNPIVGCSLVSPGCTNCYAMKTAGGRTKHTAKYEGLTQPSGGGPIWTGGVRFWEKALTDPLKWREPRRVFVNSMGDLFHEEVPNEWIDRVFAVMGLAAGHTFQVLTKRPDRMRDYMTEHFAKRSSICDEALKICGKVMWSGTIAMQMGQLGYLRNVWLGTSVEDQRRADERIPLLLQTPAAVRFISAEPLLGPIDLTAPHIAVGIGKGNNIFPDLDWVIVGGESGPHARPFHLEWADQIVDQCNAASVPCFVKQLGALPMSSGYPWESDDRKGGDWDEWPDRLKVRQYPEARAHG